MNVQDFTNLLLAPDKVTSPVQTRQLEDVLEEYPYFQAARALHLKGLKNLNSFKYNNALKTTAAYTSDRDVLFEFVSSKDFLQNNIADSILGKSTSLVDTEIHSEEVSPQESPKNVLIETSVDAPLPQTKKDADQILDPKLFTSKNPTEKDKVTEGSTTSDDALQIGTPLSFTKREKHSFTEWLKLASLKKVRESKSSATTEASEKASLPTSDTEKTKDKKFELIDRFIAANPKIVPKQDSNAEINIKASAKIDEKELMTETLARVYLEQKKYKKAIQAYRILGLKYPEKSGFFADRIKAVKKLQEKNT